MNIDLDFIWQNFANIKRFYTSCLLTSFTMNKANHPRTSVVFGTWATRSWKEKICWKSGKYDRIVIGPSSGELHPPLKSRIAWFQEIHLTFNFLVDFLSQRFVTITVRVAQNIPCCQERPSLSESSPSCRFSVAIARLCHGEWYVLVPDSGTCEHLEENPVDFKEKNRCKHGSSTLGLGKHPKKT